MSTGRPRTGSVYFHGALQKWVGAVSLGGGKRKWFYGHSEAEVREKMTARGHEAPTHNPTRAQGPLWRQKMTVTVSAVLARARALGWTDDFTAKVLAASLTVKRVRRGIVGPCVYCGDELADTVDHVLAYAAGGTDDPSNVVSCCALCNARKGKKPAKTYVTNARIAVSDAPATTEKVA